MKKDLFNAEYVTGRLYQHNLEKKTVQNKESKNFGTEFITGTVDIATDEDGLNVIPIHYTYVTEMTSGGKKNATYGVLDSIINGAKTWVTDGRDAALKLRASTALGLNDFYNQNDELVSAKRNEGGFLNTINELPPEKERSTFKFDMVITSTTRVEADPENGIDTDFVRVKGGIFNFRKALLPVELVCRDEVGGGMAYFESLDASPAEPVFTEVRGNIVSNVIKREIEEESAFGSASVRTVTRTVREWDINWARPTEYAFGEADTLTAEELKTAMQDRQVYLADIKKRRDEYNATRNAATKEAPKAAAGVPEGGFDF